MTRFVTRALEIHSNYVWDFDRIRSALDFIREHEMTALVLHRNDIVDRVVYPGTLFGVDEGAHIFERYKSIYPKLYKYTPTRRSGPYQQRDYLRRVIDVAARQGTRVYLENKELSFPDILLELHPELVRENTVCPNDPFWWNFTGTKYRELFQDLPGIAGIITAPGTGESRVAISSNRCGCERCRAATPQGWYDRLIRTMHAPIKAAGSELIIRDFVFDRKSQTALAETMEALPEDIIICLKNTPHDYYPTFPDQPRLGRVGQHRQWVEFDTMGQYFGWGVGIAVMIDDLRRRFATAQAAGAEGIILRTDWESLDGHSCFHTPNKINLHAGAALARDGAVAAEDIYQDWLWSNGMLRPDASASAAVEAAHWAKRLLGSSWDAVSKALYVNDCVFSDSSNYPVSLDHAWWLAEEKNSLQDWDPSKAGALATSEANVRAILAEKDEAVRIVGKLSAVLEERPAALTDEAFADLSARMDIFARYVSGWQAIGHATILTRYLLDHGAPSPFRREAEERLEAALARLRDLADQFREFTARTDHHFAVYLLLGWERLLTLHDDLNDRINAVTEPA